MNQIVKGTGQISSISPMIDSSSSTHHVVPVTSSASSSNQLLDSQMEIDLDAMNTLRGIIDIPSQEESRLVLTMPILRRGNSNTSDDMDALLFCKGDLLDRNLKLKSIGKEAIVRGEFLVIKKVGMLYVEVESIEFVEEVKSPPRSRSSKLIISGLSTPRDGRLRKTVKKY